MQSLDYASLPTLLCFPKIKHKLKNVVYSNATLAEFAVKSSPYSSTAFKAKASLFSYFLACEHSLKNET